MPIIEVTIKKTPSPMGNVPFYTVLVESYKAIMFYLPIVEFARDGHPRISRRILKKTQSIKERSLIPIDPLAEEMSGS